MTRGAVLPGALIFVVVVVLAASGLVAMAGSRRAVDDSWSQIAQSRLALYSGLDAVGAELTLQRADLLAGREADLTAEWTLFSEGETEWVVRLIGSDALGLGDDPFESFGPIRSDATSESARVHTEHATDATLRVLLGDDVELDTVRDAADPTLIATGSENLGVIRDRLTRFSLDPEIQGGIGGGAALASEGSARIDLSAGWTPTAQRQIADRFDESFAQSLGARMRQNPIQSLGDYLVWVTSIDARVNEDPGLLSEHADVVSFSGKAAVAGRVDVSRAAPDVLAAVLGIDNGEPVARARDALGEDARRGIGWLLADGHVSSERFVEIADALTYRSLQWRVRLEAGRRSAGSDAGVPEIDEFGVLLDREVGDGLEYRTALEAVVDVSGEQAKILLLRDVTLERWASVDEEASSGDTAE